MERPDAAYSYVQCFSGYPPSRRILLQQGELEDELFRPDDELCIPEIGLRIPATAKYPELLVADAEQQLARIYEPTPAHLELEREGRRIRSSEIRLLGALDWHSERVVELAGTVFRSSPLAASFRSKLGNSAVIPPNAIEYQEACMSIAKPVVEALADPETCRVIGGPERQWDRRIGATYPLAPLDEVCRPEILWGGAVRPYLEGTKIDLIRFAATALLMAGANPIVVCDAKRPTERLALGFWILTGTHPGTELPTEELIRCIRKDQVWIGDPWGDFTENRAAGSLTKESIGDGVVGLDLGASRVRRRDLFPLYQLLDLDQDPLVSTVVYEAERRAEVDRTFRKLPHLVWALMELHVPLFRQVLIEAAGGIRVGFREWLRNHVAEGAGEGPVDQSSIAYAQAKSERMRSGTQKGWIAMSDLLWGLLYSGSSGLEEMMKQAGCTVSKFREALDRVAPDILARTTKPDRNRSG